MTTTQKRKAVDQVNHDFSDFSLSSPATKIRRLDYAELAPILEEDEHQLEDELHMPPSPCIILQQEGTGEVENEERAIVLFNPNNTIIQHSPSTFSLSPHILSRLKGNRDLWSNHDNLLNNSSAQQGGDTTVEEEDDTSNQCLAVVPWVHSHLSPPPKTVPPIVEQIGASETMMMMMMEDEQQNEQEIASMDIEQQEECNNNGYAASGIGFGGPSVVGFHQWQQQHCMVPSQLPHNAAAAPTPTPVVWFG